MRSPSVERLIFSSSAAFDLLPPVTLSAHVMRFASTSRRRSSSEMLVIEGGVDRLRLGLDGPFRRSFDRMLRWRRLKE